MFGDPEIWQALINTFKYAIVEVPFSIIISLVLAVLLNRKMKGRAVYRTIFFLPMVAAPAAIAMVWRWLFNAEFGLLNHIFGTKTNWVSNPSIAIFSIAIIGIWSIIGYNMVLFISGLQEIPGDYYEAASIDGASGFIKLKNIIMPLMMSSVTICLFLTLSRAFMVYDVNLSLTAGAPYGTTEMAAMHVYEKAFTSRQFGVGQAEALILFIIVACISGIQVYLTKKQEVEA